MADAAELVAVGQILKPFGVKGDVRVRSLSHVPGRFQGLQRVTLVAKSGQTVETSVTRVREVHGSFVLGFEAFTTPEEAAAFRGGFVKIPREAAPPRSAGQFYEYELLGMTVADEQGQVLGTLDEILETGGNHVFVVRRQGREVLIPATREVVASVDVAGNTMKVRRVEGLLDDQAEAHATL